MFDPSFPTYTPRGRRCSRATARSSATRAFWDFQRALIDQSRLRRLTTNEFIALAKQIAQQKAGFEASNIGKLDTYFTAVAEDAGQADDDADERSSLSSSVATATCRGTVPATLSLTLGGAAELRRVHRRACAKEYTAQARRQRDLHAPVTRS